MSGSGSIDLLAAGASDSSDIDLAIDTSSAGDKSGTATIDLTSDGAGTSGLGQTALAPETVDVTGTVYREAVASVAPVTLPAIVHVGDTATVSVTNSAAADTFSEALDGTIASAPTGVTASGSIAGLGAMATSTAISLAFDAAGTVSGNLVLDFQSDGTGIDGFGPTDIGQQNVALDATIYNYAVAEMEETSDIGTWSSAGTNYTLDLGNVSQGKPVSAIELAVLNAASGPSDLLKASFATSTSSAFTVGGANDFSGLGAGEEQGLSVAFSTSTLGTFTETITLTPTDYNGPYSEDLAPETLTITGTVVSADYWSGPGAGNRTGDFGTASNWILGTVPVSGDTAVINAQGTYTVTGLQNYTVGSLFIGNANATLAIESGSLSVLGTTGIGAVNGTVAVADGATLGLSGLLVNRGAIDLLANADETDLTITGSLTLKGTGTLQMSDAGGNAIVSNGAAATLVNESTISGAGRIGDGGYLQLTNGATGVIDATGSGSGFNLAIEVATVKNSGLIEATGSAGLIVDGSLVNYGTLVADGGNLTVTGALSGTGNDTIAHGATLFLGSTVTQTQTVTFAATGGILALGAAQRFGATVAGFAANDAIDLSNFAYSTVNLSLTVSGDNAQGDDTIVTIKDGNLTAKILLLNQSAGEFSTSASAYMLTSDQHSGTAGTLLQLAAAHA